MRATILGSVIVVALLSLGAPRDAGAQPAARIARLGVLLFSTPEQDPNLATFRQGLGEPGYVEGKNLTTVYRYAEGKPDRLASLALELIE